ncbi:MAG: 4Fe-4S binding protein [Thermodesulfovibrio sp.]|nr:4Fe-4S binding protein [Thermodesulfovibrio sp.]
MKTKVKKGKIEIDAERCKGCKYCILTCPKGCIEISPNFNSSGYFPAYFFNPDSCIGCAMCAVVCPDIAIEVFIEE